MTKISNITLKSHTDSYDEVNYLVTTRPNEYIIAEVEIPLGMAQEKIDSIRWVATTVIGKRGPNFTRKNLHKDKRTNGSRIEVKMNEIYSGGGTAWIEPVFPGEQPTNKPPNGFFARCIGNSGIAQVEWREPTKNHNGAIIKEKFYGQYAELHVYTQGLYGHHLHLRLEDFKNLNKILTIDEDVDETNNDELATELVRQVKIYKDADDPDSRLQKAIFNIYLEHRWMRLASSMGSGYKIEIGGKIAVEKKGVKPFSFSSNVLLVKKKTSEDTHADPASKDGNKPVIIGNVMTEVAHINPCRYDGITKTYPGTEDATLFSTDQGINVNQRIIDIGVVSTKDSAKKLTIKVEDTDVEHCHSNTHEKTTVIDATELKEKYDDATVSEDGSTLTFTPVYPYEHIKPVDYLKFFTTYFPALLPPEADFTVSVKSCAFEKDIKLAVHPDVAFAIHIQIGRAKDFSGKNKIYYRNIDLEEELVRGLENEVKWVRQISREAEIVKKHLPNRVINKVVEEIVYDYIENTAKDIGVGLHGYHSFTASDKATLINYAKEYEWIPKTMIITGVLLSAAVDALILYITRGRSTAVQMTTTWQKIKAANKIRKRFVRHKKIIDKTLSGQLIDPASPNNIKTEFIWPELSTYRGIGYVDQENGRVAVELIERLDAAPLFALSHKITGTLGSVVAGFIGITDVFDKAEQAVGVLGYLKGLVGLKKEYDGYKKDNTINPNLGSGSKKPQDYVRTGDIQALLDYIEQKLHTKIDNKFKELFGTDAKMEAEFVGFYSASYEFRLNVLKKMMYLDIFEEDGRSIQLSDNQQLSFGRDKGVDISIKLQANSVAEQKWSRLNEYLPYYYGSPFKDTKTEAHVDGQVAGTLLFERNFRWKLEAKQPTVQDTLIFTGIAGSLYMKIEITQGNTEIFDEELGSTNLANPEEKTPITVELIPGFTINFDEQPIFEQSMWEYLMR